MKVLISSIGSRGDVQPILALALEMQRVGYDARLCVAPNFKEWVESFGVTCLAIGPDLKKLTGGTAPRSAFKPSAERLGLLAAHTVRAQFPVLIEAAKGCDLIVAAGALQFAARSVAEALQIPYFFAAYCPGVLPSPDHPPVKMGTHYSQSLPPNENLLLWREEEQRWNDLFRPALNAERENLGLSSVESVQHHIFTDRPLLAADPKLAPAGSTADLQITQYGAWFLPDRNALPNDVERFLDAGAPPVYFGLGSMRATEDATRIFVGAARALGLRSLISQGWANLRPIDTGDDCLSIGDISHEALLPRVAAIVHHGGAGTTTAAARAGSVQVIIPHLYDQYYWAHRVRHLGAGLSGPPRESMTVDAMASALQQCMRPEISAHARTLANQIEPHGVRYAAERLCREFN